MEDTAHDCAQTEPPLARDSLTAVPTCGALFRCLEQGGGGGSREDTSFTASLAAGQGSPLPAGLLVVYGNHAT